VEFAENTFEPSALSPLLYMFLSTFLVLGVLPAIYLRFVAHESLRDYGLQIGDWKAGLLSLAVLYPIVALTLLYPGSLTDGLQNQYPLDRAAGDSVGHFLSYEIVRGALFYTAWEFFFRGFMLFSLRKPLGDWVAICIQAVPSGLWHIGHPFTETTTSIIGGVLFGVIALRTRSILWPFLFHYFTGVGLDILIVLR
jgi:membrane protease YdiL (CAAX protease family)